MRCAVVFSGDVDSIFAIDFCLRQGHSVDCLISIRSEDANSIFYQSASPDLLEVMANALERPLVEYSLETGQELFEIEEFFSKAKLDYDIEGIVFDRQTNRLQRIQLQELCTKVGVKLVTPLWHQNHTEALKYLVEQGYYVLFTSVSGLEREWLSMPIDPIQVNKLIEIEGNRKVRYETVVLDGPLFKQVLEVRIGYTKMEDDFNGVYLIKEVKLADKT